MSQSQNRLLQFWQELKRRKVIKVMAMYAATAFIIMEGADIMLPRLGLPDWTVTFIVILLLVGFPITIILSWIFDVTPEGLKKTEAAKVAKEKNQPEPAKRRLKVSDVVITILVVVVVILAYPKLLPRGSLKAMTNTTTIINEFGQEEIRQVFKEEYVPKLMVMSFIPEEEDPDNAWLQYGILEGVVEDLLQFQYILTYSNPDATHLQEQITEAKLNNCPYFLTGSFTVTDGNYRIVSKLYQTINGSLEKERIFEGHELFGLFDSISLQTRIDLEIAGNIINRFPDLPIEEHVTRNLTAYRYFIYGRYFAKDFSSGGRTLNFKKAVDIDSSFALVSYHFAWQTHFYLRSKFTSKKYISLAMRHRNRLPEYRNIQVRVLNYSILEENEKAIALSEMQHELQPYNIELLLTLIDIYIINFLNDKAEDAIKKLNLLVPDYPDYQVMLAKCLLISNKLDEGLKFLEKCIEDNPGYTEFLIEKGRFHLHMGDLDNADITFRKVLLLSPEDEKKIELLLDHIAFVRSNTLQPDDLRKFVRRIRSEKSEYYFDNIIHNDLLYRKEVNQWGMFCYPLSDTSFTGIWANIFVNSKYCLNGPGGAFKLIEFQSNNPGTGTFWVQDSLIVNSEKLLEMHKHQEALIAFRKAYANNPEHYYLDHYIRHLEFLQSQEFEELISDLESRTGKFRYNTMTMEVNQVGSQLYLTDQFGIDAKMLVMSKYQSMNPSSYFYLGEYVFDGDQITGVKVKIINGDEWFVEKVSE